MLRAAASTYCRSAEPSSSGGTHRNELNGAVRHSLGNVGRERRAAGLHVTGHDQVQAGFVNGNAAFFQDADLVGVHVQAQDIVTHLGQTGAGHQAHIAGPYH